MSTIKKYVKKDIYLPKKIQEIINDLRLKQQYNNGISKIHKKIIQKKLQMRMIKKNLKKDIYLQKKDIIGNLIFNIIV